MCTDIKLDSWTITELLLALALHIQEGFFLSYVWAFVGFNDVTHGKVLTHMTAKFSCQISSLTTWS